MKDLTLDEKNHLGGYGEGGSMGAGFGTVSIVGLAPVRAAAMYNQSHKKSQAIFRSLTAMGLAHKKHWTPADVQNAIAKVSSLAPRLGITIDAAKGILRHYIARNRIRLPQNTVVGRGFAMPARTRAKWATDEQLRKAGILVGFRFRYHNWNPAQLAQVLNIAIAAFRKFGLSADDAKQYIRSAINHQRIQLTGGASVVGKEFSPDDPTSYTRENTARTLGKNVREAFVGGPEGEVPRTMRRDVHEAFIGSRAGQATRSMLRDSGEHFIGSLTSKAHSAAHAAASAAQAVGRKVTSLFHKKAPKQEPYYNSATPRAQLRTTRETFVGAAAIINAAIAKTPRGKRAVIPGALIDTLLSAKSDLYNATYGKPATPARREAWKQTALAKVNKAGARVSGTTYIGDWLSSLAKIPGKVVSKGVELAARAGFNTIVKAPITLAKGTINAVYDLSHGRVLQAGKDFGGAAVSSVRTMFYDPVKKTFFPGGGGKKPAQLPPQIQPQPGMLPTAIPPGTVMPISSMTTMIPPNYYSNPNIPRLQLGPGSPPPLSIMPNVQQMAQEIAQRKAYNKQQYNELQARLQVAQDRKTLADLELSEKQKLSDLDAQAAEAEAEAAQAEADLQAQDMVDATGYDNIESVLGAAARTWKKQTLMGEAREAAIAKAVLQTAGQAAKLAILESPFKGLFNAAVKIFHAAKADPKGPEKVAALKDAAKKGDPKAEKAIDVLKLGKATSEQLAAAKAVEKEFIKAGAKEAAKVSGCGADEIAVIGMLPSNEAVIATIPGASTVYKLAKAGNPEMLKAVNFAADLLRKSAAGDARSKKILADYGTRAKKGDKTAQLFMAAAAVAGAGLREEAAHRKVAAQPAVKKETAKHVSRLKQKVIAIAKPVKAMAHEALEHYEERSAEGLALKLQFGGAHEASHAPVATPRKRA